jgi:hypothetical protein
MQSVISERGNHSAAEPQRTSKPKTRIHRRDAEFAAPCAVNEEFVAQKLRATNFEPMTAKDAALKRRSASGVKTPKEKNGFLFSCLASRTP